MPHYDPAGAGAAHRVRSDPRARRTTVNVRRLVILGAPLAGYVAALLHPGLTVGESPRLFLAVHVALPAIVCLLAWMMLFLVEGIEGAAATAARVLTIPFAVAYTAFTAFGGVAIGAFVWKTNELPAGKQRAAAELIHSVSHSALARPLYLVASLLWLAAMLAVVVALWSRTEAPRLALVLLAIGAAAFARSHVRPWGPAGMAAVLAAVIWLELASRSAPERRDHVEQSPPDAA